MAQVHKVVDPFGEVNVYPAKGGKLRVVATILMEPRREGNARYYRGADRVRAIAKITL